MAEEASVGQIYLNLGVDASGIASQITQATNQANKQALAAFNKMGKNTTNQVKSIGNNVTSQASNIFSGLGKKIAAGLGVAAIAHFGKSCVDLGSDLTEVQNVVDTAFGGLSGSADAWAKNSMNDFGLSETSAKKYMGVFGQMSSAMGITGQAALDMSEQVTGLTGDVASFYNISQDEAYTKLKSIWTGETESLKDLGVVMTQTNLDQYALNNGFGKTTAAMTQQEQTMLRFQYVTSALSNASGDFIKTQDTWANQTRVLSLRFQQFKATLGQGFINIFTPVIKCINTILAGLQKLADGFSSFTSALLGVDNSSAMGSIGSDLSGVTSDLSDASTGAADTASNVAGIGDAAKDTAKEIQKSMMGFDSINKLTDTTDDSSSDTGTGSTGAGSTGSVGNLGAVNGQLLGGVEVNPEIAKAIAKLKDLLDPTEKAFDRLKESMKPLKTFVATGAMDFYRNFLVPLGKYTLSEKGLPRFLNITADICDAINWSGLNGNLASFWSALEKLGEFSIDVLLDFYENFLQPIAVWTMNTGLPTFLDVMTNIVNNVDWGKLEGSLSNLYTNLANLEIFKYDVLLSFLTNFLQPLAVWTYGEGLPKLYDIISNGLGQIDYSSIITSIDGVFSSVAQFTENVGDGLLWFIENVLVPLSVWCANEVVPAVFDDISAAFGVLNSAIDAISPLAQWLFDNFLKPLAEWTGGIIVSVLQNLGKALEGVSSWISDNQGLVEGMTVAVGLFAAAWEGVNLGAFIVNAGGVTGALGKLSESLSDCTIKKVKDQIEIVKIVGLYAKDFVKSIASGTVELVKNGAQWVINTASTVAATTATVAHTVATTAATTATWLFNAALAVLTSPITLVVAAVAALVAGIYLLVTNWSTVTQVASDVWDGIVAIWSTVAEWFDTNVIQPLAGFFSGLWQGIVNVWSGTAEWFGGIFTDAWNAICNAFSVIGQWFTDRWTDVCNAFSGVSDWFGGIFSSAWDGICNAFSAVGNFFGGVWDSIKNTFSNVTDWFKNIFSGAWQAVKDVFCTGGQIFDGITDGILSGLKSVVNAIIGGINKVIKLPFDGLNGALGKLRSINIAGVSPFTWLPKIGVPQIPKLAQGGYVQPNTPQLAMIGDNRHQGEVVAPEDKLKAMAQEAANMGGSAALMSEAIAILKAILKILQELDLDIQIDGMSLKKYIVQKINDNTIANGKCEIIT